MAVDFHRLWLVLAVFCACSSDPPRPEPVTSVAQSPLTRTGIEGCNCAGAAPVMAAPDGGAYPFQSIVSYYYEVLQAFWTEVDGDDVLKTWLPASIEAVGEEFYAWQAKSVQIYRDRDLLGFAHRYYRGTFGFLAGEGGEEATCSAALDEATRTTGMLAHVGLSQAGVCGENDDGTTKFWQVNRIVLLMIGDVVDAFALVDAGLAEVVAVAPVERCILPATLGGGPIATPVGEPGAMMPCRVAFRADAVTEAVVLPVPSSATVAGVPLRHRAFTAAGTVAMPNALDQVRKILRDGQLRAMYAIGLPRFAPEPSAGPTHVRLIDHVVGPAREANPLLLPEERAWVDGTVGVYNDRCCHVECEGEAAAVGADRPGERLAMAGRSVVRRDAGVSDAPPASDAALVDAGVPIELPADAVVALPDAAPLPFPDAGPFPPSDGGAFPFPDGGPFPSPDGGAFPSPDGGAFPLPDGGAFPSPDGGAFPFPDGGAFPSHDGGAFPFPDGGAFPFPDASVPPPPPPPSPGHDAGAPPPPPTPGHDAGVPPPVPADAGTPPPPPGPGCHTVCVAEGACASTTAATGLVVMVSAQTTTECNGSCPEPATGAPATQPTCAP